MPELPEVHTTVMGLNKKLPGLTIKSLWNDMFSAALLSKNTVKEKKYFPYFEKLVVGAKIKKVERRAKYILIHLNNGYTIIIHMKMTGHLMYGKYKEDKSAKSEWKWRPIDKQSALNDPFNRHIRFVFSFSNGHQLALSDTRKFGTIAVEKTENLHSERLKHLGPEPLPKDFDLKKFKERLLLSSRPIKTVLMDQTIVAGIGNIYSDEMLFRARVKPTRKTSTLNNKEWKDLFAGMKGVLKKGIEFGGDSMSDYRNINGERGKFQDKHLVYLRKNKRCLRKGCGGTIVRLVISGRSSHFCDTCQK